MVPVARAIDIGRAGRLRRIVPAPDWTSGPSVIEITHEK
jgi:hypothetical protein